MALFSLIFCLLVTQSFVTAQDNCDSGPNNTDPNDCCATPMLVSIEIISECLTKYGDMQKRINELPGPRRGCCIGDCITEKMGVNPTGDGNIDRDGLRKKLVEYLKGDTTFADTFNTAIDKCFAIVDTKADEYKAAFELKPAFEGEKICHPISGKTLGCISNEIFLNCPAGVWKASDECDAIKAYVQRCETIPRHA
uniref:CSON009644 protein n=1 Tax=Culicoides sonorensis TaxID=179676 RepID=A0A336MYG6_CULSO